MVCGGLLATCGNLVALHQHHLLLKSGISWPNPGIQGSVDQYRLVYCRLVSQTDPCRMVKKSWVALASSRSVSSASFLAAASRNLFLSTSRPCSRLSWGQRWARVQIRAYQKLLRPIFVPCIYMYLLVRLRSSIKKR